MDAVIDHARLGVGARGRHRDEDGNRDSACACAKPTGRHVDLRVGGASLQRHDIAYTRNLPESLAREATVTEAQAIAVATKVVPKGHVSSIELDREGGSSSTRWM